MLRRPDPTLVALLAAAAVVVAWAVIGADPGARLLVAPPALLVGALIVGGRRHPFPCVTGAFAGLVIGSGLGGRETENAFLIGLVVACFLAGRYGVLAHLPWLGAGVLLLIYGAMRTGNAQASDAAFPVLFTVGPCLLGVAVQLAVTRERRALSQAELLDAMRAEEVRRAAVEERLRIARDLHDLVAHDISAVSLQAQVSRREAEAGRYVDPAALQLIETSARRAMDDARRLLGVLRVDDPADTSPAPGLDDVDALVATLGELGQRVDVRRVGEARPLPPALSQAAFRVVQEALTNARRHGDGGPTSLSLAWTPTELRLTVANAYAADAADRATRPGHGTTGIAERVELFGGHATIGGRDGRWVVDVTLPVPASTTPVS